MQIVKRKRAQATPHLYIDFIPFTTGSKRGLETRVSLKMVLEALGFAGGTKSHTELNQWIETEKTKYSIKNRFHPSKGRNGF